MQIFCYVILGYWWHHMTEACKVRLLALTHQLEVKRLLAEVALHWGVWPQLQTHLLPRLHQPVCGRNEQCLSVKQCRAAEVWNKWLVSLSDVVTGLQSSSVNTFGLTGTSCISVSLLMTSLISLIMKYYVFLNKKHLKTLKKMIHLLGSLDSWVKWHNL